MKRTMTITALAVSTSMLAGCQQYLARQDLIEPYTGNAVATNQALQMADPWPPYVYDTSIPTNGRRQANGYMKYSKKDEEKPPQEIAPIQLVVPQTN